MVRNWNLLNTFITAILTAAILFLYSSSHSISRSRYLLIFVAFSAVSQQFTNLAKSIAALLASVPTYFSKNALRDLDQFNNYQTPGLHILSRGNLPNSIELIDVDFAYDSQHRVITDFQKLFKADSNYCINGLSGSGKSTLLKVIAGHYTPSNGSILINNQANSQRFSQLLKFNVIYPSNQKTSRSYLLKFLRPHTTNTRKTKSSLLFKRLV